MPEPLLDVRALDAFYGDFQALFGVSIAVERGEVVAVIGANGAGKSTLLQAHRRPAPRAPRRDRLRRRADRRPAGRTTIVARGIALVPEGRRLFPSLTVEENLLIGGQLGRAGPWTLDARLRALSGARRAARHAASTSLSGGQQQMVAIGRALMANPRLLLCDEISLGLAPIVVREIYRALPAIVAEGTRWSSSSRTSCRRSAAQRVYCLQEGRVSLAGRAGALTREAIAAAYFGV